MRTAGMMSRPMQQTMVAIILRHKPSVTVRQPVMSADRQNLAQADMPRRIKDAAPQATGRQVGLLIQRNPPVNQATQFVISAPQRMIARPVIKLTLNTVAAKAINSAQAPAVIMAIRLVENALNRDVTTDMPQMRIIAATVTMKVGN